VSAVSASDGLGICVEVTVMIIRCSFAVLFLGLLLSYADLRMSDSEYEVFKAIRIGMPATELNGLFRATGAQPCRADADGGSCAGSTYDFSDYSREYHVSVDSRTGRVSLLTFSFKHRSDGLPRLFRRTR